MPENSVRDLILDIIEAVRPALGSNYPGSIEAAIDIGQRLEKIRIFLSRGNRGYFVESELNFVRNEFDVILSMKGFSKFANRKFPPLGRARGYPEFHSLPIRSSFLSIEDAFSYIIRLLESVPFQSELSFSQDATEAASKRLARIVPDQKIGPVRFKIENDVLKVEQSPAVAQIEDRQSATSARAALLEQGKKILDGLRDSNCDFRFIESIEDLQLKLHESKDIIQLGIANLSCDEMRKQFENEMPDVLAARLRAHLVSIGWYVGQFPEWARYSENAAAVELNEADIRRSQEVAKSIISELHSIPQQVDSEVPRTIKFIMDAIVDPKNASKRASYALFSTLENLFSKIFRYAVVFVDEFVTTSSKTAAKWGASAVAMIFVKAVLEGAGALAPIYARLPDAAWIKSAVEIMKQISF